MPAIIDPPDKEPPLASRLAWFAGIAAASSGAVIAIAYALKALLR